MKLYNTYTRSVDAFEPLVEGKVGMYACGPTVYSSPHIGNLRTYITVDNLRRLLDELGYKVKHVMNITDVGHLTNDSDDGDDKMELAARREAKSAWDIAKEYEEEFFRFAEELNIKRPHVCSRATDHIQEQVDFVAALFDAGFAYQTEDGIYFDTSRDSDYGYLARLDLDNLRAGERVELRDKKNKTDFALWKFSLEDRQMEWDSPWGKGFPGWHIECSAMARKYLGDVFDIHTGGIDHIPVHHSNEIAQTKALTGEVPSRWWVHGEFLTVDSGRMGKSEGNAMTLDTVQEKGFRPVAYRYLCGQSHYRKTIVFSWDSLEVAQTAWERLEAAIDKLPDDGAGRNDAVWAELLAHLENDLNAPAVIAKVWTLVKAGEAAGLKATVVEFLDSLLGLRVEAPQVEAAVELSPDLQALLDERGAAKTAKDWGRADEIRDAIQAMGFKVVDTPDGPTVEAL